MAAREDVLPNEVARLAVRLVPLVRLRNDLRGIEWVRTVKTWGRVEEELQLGSSPRITSRCHEAGRDGLAEFDAVKSAWPPLKFPHLDDDAAAGLDHGSQGAEVGLHVLVAHRLNHLAAHHLRSWEGEAERLDNNKGQGNTSAIGSAHAPSLKKLGHQWASSSMAHLRCQARGTCLLVCKLALAKPQRQA